MYISKLLAFQRCSTLRTFPIFLHAPREAQSVHLKAFGFSAQRTFLIFLMRPENLKLRAFGLSALRTFQIFFMHPEKLKVHISKLLAFQHFDNFYNFSHTPREAQSVHLKAFGFSARITFAILPMHPDKLKVHISKLLAFQHFDNFSNFLHALREAQSAHLKAFGFSALRTFPIFFMHSEKLKVHISKLLAFQH